MKPASRDVVWVACTGLIIAGMWFCYQTGFRDGTAAVSERAESYKRTIEGQNEVMRLFVKNHRALSQRLDELEAATQLAADK